MITVSYVNNDNETINKHFNTNIELNDWMRIVRSPFHNSYVVYIRFKDGHNVEFIRNNKPSWKPTYAK